MTAKFLTTDQTRHNYLPTRGCTELQAIAAKTNDSNFPWVCEPDRGTKVVYGWFLHLLIRSGRVSWKFTDGSKLTIMSAGGFLSIKT